ncbi:MAG: glycosyltransferase, partial [Herbinix sp.]|nr:glycosyltransferase [Herbinix sp.]
MRILQINSVCGVGSTGRITTDLYKVLEDQGHECCICYGRGTAPKTLNTIRIGSDLDIYKHALYTRITDKTAFASKKATERLIHQMKQYNPDIVHLHNLHGYYINLKLLFNYFKESGMPVIWSLYDCWSFTGHCCHFDYIGCNKWKSGCYQCEQKKNYPKSLFYDNSKANYLRKKSIITSYNRIIIVPPTKWLSNLLMESFLSDYPTVIIPSGIDLEVFKPTKSDLRTKYQLKNKYIILGVLNGFQKNKGSKYFIELA